MLTVWIHSVSFYRIICHVKSVEIPSFFWSKFRYRDLLRKTRSQAKYGKTGAKKTTNLDIFFSEL